VLKHLVRDVPRAKSDARKRGLGYRPWLRLGDYSGLLVESDEALKMKRNWRDGLSRL
jgi:hypothetical protein